MSAQSEPARANLGGSAGIPSSRPFVDGSFLFCIYVVARSALVLRDEAISYTVGDCFGQKITALAMTG